MDKIEEFQGREVMDVQRFSRSLERQLTDEQVNDLGRQLAALYGKIETVDAERVDAAKGYSNRLKELKGTAQNVARKMRERKEETMTPCAELLDLNACKAMVVRLDTLDVIDTRTMAAAEVARHAQQPLDLGADEQPAPDVDACCRTCSSWQAPSGNLETAGTCATWEDVTEPDQACDSWTPREDSSEDASGDAPEGAGEETPDGKDADPGAASEDTDPEPAPKKKEAPKLPDGTLCSTANMGPLKAFLADAGLPIPAGKGSRARARKMAAAKITGAWDSGSMKPAELADWLDQNFGPFAKLDG